MKNFFIFLLLISSFLHSHESTIRLAAESEPLLTVAGCVNVLSGDFFQIDPDLNLGGTAAFSYTRLYDSGHQFLSKYGYGIGLPFPLLLKHSRENCKGGGIELDQRQGFHVPFKAKKLKDWQVKIKINPEIYKHGYTNSTEALFQGDPSLSHTEIFYWGNFNNPSGGYWTAVLSDYTRRIYHFSHCGSLVINHEKEISNYYYTLRQEMLPNGFNRFYEYADHHLKRVYTTNRGGEEINSLLIDFNEAEKRYTVSGSHGLSTSYLLTRIEEKMQKKNHSFKEIKANFLTAISAEHLPETSYEFLKNKKWNSFLKVGSVKKPNGRFLQVLYDHEGRVSELRAPIGFDPLPQRLYQFAYDHGKTLVTNPLKGVTQYFFSKKRVIKRTDANIRNYLFSWSDQGELLTKSIAGPTDLIVSRTSFIYDSRGNIIEKRQEGNISGKGYPVISHVHGEKSVTKYSYSNDCFNLLLKEELPNGSTIHYRYLQDTNLPIAKYVSSQGKIELREFRSYDLNNSVIQIIEDDGSSFDQENLTDVTYRLITDIEPDLDKTSYGFTLPKVIHEFAFDCASGTKIPLKKTELTYAKGGVLADKKVFDADGIFSYSSSYCYNSHFKLIEEVNPLGEVAHFSYDSLDNKIAEEKGGKRCRYTYDLANRLVAEEETHDDGTILKSTYTYDKAGNCLSMTDPYENQTEYSYDLLSRKISEKDPFGFYTTTRYDILDNPVSITDKEGYTTETKYTVFGKPYHILYPDETEEECIYDMASRLLLKKERDGHYQRFTYDYQDRVILKEKLDSNRELLSQEVFLYKGKNLIAEIDALGIATTYQYDAAGRKISMQRGDLLETYAYDSLNRLYKTTRGERVTLLTFDALDRILSKKTKDLEGRTLRKKKYSYDVNGNRTSIKIYTSKSHFSETKTLYNSLNLPILIRDPLGNETHISYLHRNIFEKITIDPLGQKKHERFDALKRLVSIEISKEEKLLEPVFTSRSDDLCAKTHYIYAKNFRNIHQYSENFLHKCSEFIAAKHPDHDCEDRFLAKEEYFYSPNGYKIRQENAMIEEGSCKGISLIEWSYDSMGNLLSLIEQGEKKTFYTYSLGRLSILQKPDSVLLSHSYDALGRLSSLSSSDGTIHYLYHYDLADNLLEVEDLLQNTTTKRTYDLHHRLIHEKLAHGACLSFDYDLHDRIRNITLPDETKIEYLYDAKNLLAIKRNGKSHHYTYDLAGNILSEKTFHDQPITYSYDANQRTQEIQAPTFSEYLTYDRVGNLISMQTNEEERTFVYNDLYQLIQEKGSHSHIYSFDSLHNRLSKDENTYSYNHLHWLLQEGTASYYYDLNGNRLSKGEKEYRYDALNRLIEAEGISYSYDSFGRLFIRKEKEKEEHFLYFNEYELGETSCLRILGKGIAAIEQEKCLYPLIRDHRGSIVRVLDEKNIPLADYSYTAFGECSHSGSFHSPWQYSAQRIDSKTNLIHFQKRIYDPHTGRWLTPDPLGFADGPNLYAYLHNNPLIHIDLEGFFTQDLWGNSKSALSGGFQGGKNILMDPVTTGNRYWDYGRMLSNAIYHNDYSVIAQKWNSKDLNGKIEFVSERAIELGITFGLLGKTILHGGMGGIYRGGVYVAGRVGSAFARSEAKNIAEGAFAKESSTPIVKGISDIVRIQGKNKPRIQEKTNDIIHVSPQGVAIPPGAKYQIPKHYIENIKRAGSYGEHINGKFVEKLRIDPATSPSMKGPNYSHYHRNGKKTHYSPRPGEPDPGFNQ